MNILFFGDVVGQPGRAAIKKILPTWKEKHKIDFTIANCENIAHGKGITEQTLNEMFAAGIDLATSGDHIWSKEEARSLLTNKKYPLIRPANYPEGAPGNGYYLAQLRTKKILVINLIGRVFMRQQYDDPFRKADQIIDEIGDEADAIIVDWHAEATSEKVCLGWYLDGRVSAVLGTHTHIPTADARILPQGAAYISDVGMTGAKNSSLGAKKELAIESFLTQMPFKYEVSEEDPAEINAVVVKIGKNKQAEKIKLLQEIIDLR